MAAAEASLSTSSEAMSFGLISESGPSYGMPSRTTSGSVLAVIELRPRMRTLMPGSAPPDEVVTVTPGVAPCSACTTLVLGLSRNRVESTETMAPVTSSRRWVP